MAEKIIGELEGEISCLICLDTYTDPKLLQCNHVFCRKCLVKLVIRDQDGRLVIPCPSCRQFTPVTTTNGVAGLQSAFHINRLLEIVERNKQHTTLLKSFVSLSSFESMCLEHGKEGELYCETCGKLVCWKCTRGEHKGHDCNELEEAFAIYKEEITALIEPLEEKQLTIDTELAELHDKRVVAEGLLWYKTCMSPNDRLDELDRKLKLAMKWDELMTAQTRLRSFLCYTKEILGSSDKEEALMAKTALLAQANELLIPIQSPDSNDQVSSSDLPDPSKCYVTEIVETTIAGEKSAALLVAINFNNQPCQEPINYSDIELVCEKTGARTRGSIERKDQNQYNIRYMPTMEGEYYLHVKVDGQHVKGSPFAMAVKSSDKPGLTPDEYADLLIQSDHNIGNGAFGSVFKATYKEVPCAAKLLTHHAQEVATGLKTTAGIQSESMKAFKKECEYLKLLEHKNIVHHLATVIEPKSNLPVLVMELMDCSLKRYLESNTKQKRVLSTLCQISLCLDITRGLAYLHSQELIHRDLCDDNILLLVTGDTPIAKIADFGMSRILPRDYLSQTLTGLGHREVYMPQEARDDPYHYSHTLDVYSFGVIATQIVKVVTRIPNKEKLQSIVTTIPDTHKLKRIIQICLTEDRKKRPHAASITESIQENEP